MPFKFALVGNPNCGKTTLFNELTGSKQYVGNWPGVTVDKKIGYTREGGHEVADLPGIYSLSPYSMEEIITRDYIIQSKPDVILNIVDGTNIERNLYLTLQVMELGRPVVLVVNMLDEIEARGDKFDWERMGAILGAQVLPVSARKGTNLKKLIPVLERAAKEKRKPNLPVYDHATQNALHEILVLLSGRFSQEESIHFYAAKLIEGDSHVLKKLSLNDAERKELTAIIARYEATAKLGDRETMMADARYKYISTVIAKTVERNPARKRSVSEYIDMVVTNRVLAIPIFLLIIFCMFALTFGTVGATIQGWLEYLFNDLIGVWVHDALVSANAPQWTFSLLIDAIIGGVGGVLVFLPQITLLFLCLSFLEDSGYMARAAFIMDTFMRKIGLSGKSFIPMLMGFGCTTPAVMAARTLENERDRRLTILLTPFMSCGARLPIYAVFAGAFFGKMAGIVIFSMYVLGLVIAIVCGFVLKKTLFRDNNAGFIMELPPYRLPSMQTILIHTWEKCKGFLIKAGTIIFSMTVVIWFLQHFSLTMQYVTDSGQSIIGSLGRLLAPVFAPLGFGQWEASVSLLTGLVAKEAVVSTMGILYGVGDAAGSLSAILPQVFTPASALSFMIFCLLYTPCISAITSIRREMNSGKWTMASIGLQLGIAYTVSLTVYQIARLFL